MRSGAQMRTREKVATAFGAWMLLCALNGAACSPVVASAAERMNSGATATAAAGAAEAAEAAAEAAAGADECPEVVARADWGAAKPKLVERQEEPVPYVIIHHTYTPGVCNTSAACAAAMRSMQNYHQKGRGWNDIGYNFAVGGDGHVYEGRGWGVVGAHAPRYNNRSIGISLIGDYASSPPSAVMEALAQRLIACGVEAGHVAQDYRLLGHRQVRNTECPGDAFYAHVQRWPHWVSHPDDSLPTPAPSPVVLRT